jgi:hypothetical protein
LREPEGGFAMYNEQSGIEYFCKILQILVFLAIVGFMASAIMPDKNLPILTDLLRYITL